MTNEVQISDSVAKKTPKKKKIASLERRKSRAGWFFILPFIVGLLLIYLPIIRDSLVLSFQTVKIDPTGAVIKTWVGWQNYQVAMFEDVDFARSMLEGLLGMVSDIPMIIIFSLFMAVLLNQNMAGRAAFRAIFFVPVIISTGLMEKLKYVPMDAEEMGPDMGDESVDTTTQIVSAMDIALLFENMKIGTGLVEFVTNAVNNIYNIVNRSGVQMLIFLSGLQSISPAIYESCSIDGASTWETFWKITFPMISPMILVNGVYTIIDSFTTDSNTVMAFIQEAYGKANGQVLSTAMSWIYFSIVIAIVAACAGIFSAFVFYQRRD